MRRLVALLAPLVVACGRVVTASPDASDAALDGSADRPEVIDSAPRDPSPVFSPWEASTAPCSDDGWCWEHPDPAGGEIVSISTSAPTDGWALTRDGVLLRTTPTGLAALRVHRYDATRSGEHVWSAGPDDTWVSIREGMLHWNGRTLERVRFYDGFNEPALVWGRDARDVWLAGAQGDVLHFDGARWTRRAIPTAANVVALAGGGEAEVWALAGDGVLWRWRGGAWVAGETVERSAWRSPWILGPDDAWACDAGEARHWNGRLWERFVVTASPTSDRCTVWSDGTSVWFSDGLSVRRRSDGPWNVEGETYFVTAAGGSAQNIWLGRSDGVVQRIEGDRWVGVTRTRPRFDIVRLAGDDDATLRALSVGALYAFDGARWFDAAAPTRFYELAGVWPVDARDTWLVGSTRDGTRDGGRASRWNRDDGERDLLSTELPLRAIAASGAEQVIAVGDGGAAWRFDGRAWSRMETGTNARLLDVWVGAPDVAWAVGDNVALRWDGSTWRRVPLPFAVTLSRVSARNDSDVWMLGQNTSPARTEVLHWDGRAITRDTAGLPEGQRFDDVWADADAVWLAGATVLRRDARVWNRESVSADVTLRAVRGTREGAVRVGGSGAAVFVRRPR